MRRQSDGVHLRGTPTWGSIARSRRLRLFRSLNRTLCTPTDQESTEQNSNQLLLGNGACTLHAYGQDSTTAALCSCSYLTAWLSCRADDRGAPSPYLLVATAPYRHQRSNLGLHRGEEVRSNELPADATWVLYTLPSRSPFCRSATPTL